jgi:uridine kinase
VRNTLWMVAVARFQDLAHQVMAMPGPVRLVGVDGCGGAGKSTFAARLAVAAGGAPVVHTDDFASHDVPIEWWPRMLADVVEPLLAGRPAVFTSYDWVSRGAGPVVTVPPAPVVIVEGVGATRRAWRDRLALTVWIDTPPAERLRRGLARDGEELAEFWQEWIVAEDAYVAAEDPRGAVELVVDGDAPAGYDPETEFVIARRAEREPTAP